MNETLSVIDEHITDLSTPRHSLAPPDLRAASASNTANNHHNNSINNDSGSEYSAHMGSRRYSYINGQETDEEEDSRPTEDQVRKWGHQETAKHLRDLGVDDKHCDIFEEQEITGDVLLDMDQDFLFMKEFDFGVMGRRLKTWHKVKAFQEDVKGATAMSSTSSSPYPGGGGGAEELPRSASRAAGHTSGGGTFLPRIPTFTEKSSGTGSGGGYVGQSRASTSSANQQHHSRLSSIQSTNSSYGIDRPSAASVRGINHSRRHSSIDTTNRSFDLGSDSAAAAAAAHPSSSMYSHQGNKSSLDRSWSMAGAGRRPPTRPGTSLGTSTTIMGGPDAQHRAAAHQQPVDANECDSAISVTDRYDDLDRGYFSGPEGDKKNRRVLTKRSSDHKASNSLTHSRQSSYTNDDSARRHSRIASIDSIRDAARATKPTPSLGKNRLRSLSTRLGSSDGSNNNNKPEAKSATSTTPGSTNTSPMGTGLFSFAKSSSSGDGSARSSTIPFKNAGPKIRRAVGLDSNSSSPSTNSPTNNNSKSDSPTRDEPAALARTGSATPSAASKTSSRHSADRQSTGSSGKAAADLAFPRTRPSMRGSNVKSKQETSAYIQGLEKKAPKEQMEVCDYSGWMKKRSSNLMTTWKPRLFVLRGRRLSYYYSETDKEERGLIDITGHRVLRADNDPIVTLHATITGSTTSPTSPATANGVSPSTTTTTTTTEKTSSESVRNLKGENSGPFFFKLVPPKAGYARSVQFTKPAIHYFQVDTIREGRLWMAALMKATIERDLEQPIESTNKQKTISLKQARLTNQRPPALSTPDPREEDEDEAEAEANEGGNEGKDGSEGSDTNDSSGLGLGALGLDKPTPESSDPDGKELPAKPLGSNPLGGIDAGPSLLQDPVIARD